MTRTWIALGAFAVVLGVSGAANAQSATGGTFGQRGQFILGGERLTGFYSWKVTNKENAPQNGVQVEVERTTSGSQLAFLWGASGVPSLIGVNPGAIPRLGADYMLTELISLGGSLGYYSASGSSKVGGTSQDTPSYSGFALAPRVGFAIKLNDVIAFWPRVGIVYFSQSIETQQGNATTITRKFSGMDVVAEGYFVISPVANFGFGVAPIIELPLSGTFKTETKTGANTDSRSVDGSFQNIGITAGLLGYF